MILLNIFNSIICFILGYLACFITIKYLAGVTISVKVLEEEPVEAPVKASVKASVKDKAKALIQKEIPVEVTVEASVEAPVEFAESKVDLTNNLLKEWLLGGETNE